MICHGDELGRTQGGNNNGYCQDNEITWIDWANADTALHRVHPVGVGAAGRAPGVPAPPVLQRHAGAPAAGPSGLPDISWFAPDGSEMTDEDWGSGFGKSIAVYLNGQGIPDLDLRGQRVTDDSFVLCFNAHHEPIDFTLPPGIRGGLAAGDLHRRRRRGATRRAGIRGRDGHVEARSILVLQAAAE